MVSITVHQLESASDGRALDRFSLVDMGPGAYVDCSAETASLIARALAESSITRAEWSAAVEAGY